MGSVTAKIMREAKEARTMGDGGAGFDGDGDVTVEGSEFDLAGPQSEGRRGPVGFSASTDVSGPGGGSMMGGPGITAPGPVPEGTVSPDGGGAEPGELRQGPTLQKEKDQTREQIKQKRKRRRSLISEEEEGELGAGPVYRRSILGG